MRRLEATCTAADTYTRYGHVMARDTPAAPSLCRRNRATCAFAAGGLLRFAYRTSEILRAAARAGVEAPQIVIEQSIGRFSMQVARTPMAWILPVRGIASFALDRHSGRVHDAAEPKAPRATGAPRSMRISDMLTSFPLSSMASPRLSTRHFGIRKPAQVWTDAASRHSPPFGPGA